MNKKIVFILTCFRKPNNYFSLWCNSASKSKICDFVIYSDQNIDVRYDNIFIKSMTLKEFELLAQEKLCENYNVRNGYKVCNYRPAFGIIFSDLIKDYEYWGYCDMDVIFGNLDTFLCPILGKYDKYFQRGHMTIFKNDFENNHRFLQKPKNKEFFYFYDTISIDFNSYFEECSVIGKLWEKNNYSSFNSEIFEDLSYSDYCFKTTVGKFVDCRKIYEYDDGNLYVVYNDKDKIIKTPILYIHLQKRKMKVLNNDLDHFFIVPNKFISCNQVKNLKNTIKKASKNNYYYKCFKLFKYKFNIFQIIRDYKDGKAKWDNF